MLLLEYLRTLLEPFPPLSRERNRSCPNLARSSQTGPILILVFLALLLEDCCAKSSSSFHSLYYSYTFVSKPSQGLPEFSILESIDDQPIAHYDSHTKEYRSLVPWMEQVKKEEPLWKEYTEIAKKAEQGFGRNLVTLKKYYNHSEGFHTLQWRYGCELSNDWPRGGSDQDGYDGRTFISFDKKTLSWTAIDAAAQLSKRKLEGNPSVAKHIKYYLEETCIEMLRRRITYGKEALLRKEPIVTVTSKAEIIQTETHICRVDGFFPKDINATWRKDGEIWLQDTLYGLVVPNSDGTYHFWLSIRINPNERNHFQCHVEHDSMKCPLQVVLMVPVPHPVSIIMTVLAAIFLASAYVYLGVEMFRHWYMKKMQKYSGSHLRRQNYMGAQSEEARRRSADLTPQSEDRGLWLGPPGITAGDGSIWQKEAWFRCSWCTSYGPTRTRKTCEKTFKILCMTIVFLLAVLAFALLYYIGGSAELYHQFSIVFLSVSLLEVVGLFVWRSLKKMKIWLFSSKQDVSEPCELELEENHQEPTNSDRSNQEVIPLQDRILNNSAGEEN